MTAAVTLDDVVRLISSTPLSLSSETRAQDDLEAALVRAGIPYEREAILSSKDRIDFMIGDVGVEMKIDGSPRSIFRQVERYSAHERIASLVLATNKAMTLPSSIGGKPASVVSLGMGWL